MNQTNEHGHVCVIYINASREAVWEGLTSAEFTRQYFHATSVESDWTPGADVSFYNPDRSIAVTGKVLEVEFPAKLVFTWHVQYNPEARKEVPSRLTYRLDSVQAATRLTIIHDEFPNQSVVLPQITEGWIAIISNLKTLLETGEVMAVS